MSSYIAHRGWRSLVTYGPGVGGLVLAVIALIDLHGQENAKDFPYWALLVASVMYVLVLAALEHIGRTGPLNRAQYGWVGLLIGADGRLSTSKTQAVLWTVVLATAVVFLGGIVAFGPGSGPDLFDATHWEQYLVLLGGPFAAAVLAKFTTVSKLEAGTIAKSLTSAASPQALGTAPEPAPDAGAEGAPADTSSAAPPATVPDLVSNDAGEIEIPDAQYVVFNLAAIAYFLLVYFGQIFSSTSGLDRFVLPDIPSVLLGLTSASAATYVGYKAAQRDAPRVVSLLPQPASVGNAVQVVGANLVPAGETAPAARTAVTLQSLTAGDADNRTVVAPDPGTPVTASSLGFIMPAQFAGKTVAVRVVTSGSVATDPVQVVVS